MRVKIELDLNIQDEAAARALAREYLIAVTDQTVMDGGTLQMSKATPAESIDAILAQPRPLATTSIMAVLVRGLGQTSAVTISDVAASVIDPPA
jgi:hypothetical protein